MRLPKEIIWIIAKKSNIKTRCAMACVSRHWYLLTNDHLFVWNDVIILFKKYKPFGYETKNAIKEFKRIPKIIKKLLEYENKRNTTKWWHVWKSQPKCPFISNLVCQMLLGPLKTRRIDSRSASHYTGTYYSNSYWKFEKDKSKFLSSESIRCFLDTCGYPLKDEHGHFGDFVDIKIRKDFYENDTRSVEYKYLSISKAIVNLKNKFGYLL